MTAFSRALRRLALFPLPALLALGAAPLGAQQSTAAFDAVRTGLGELAVDPEATTGLRDLTLARETGEIHLVEGTLALLRPIDGRPPGMVFAGEGRFTMTAPIAIERDQLVRFLETDHVDETFRGALFLFTDGTLAELEASGVSFGPGGSVRDHERMLDDADDYLEDRETRDPDRTTLSALLNRGRDGHAFFHAHMLPGGERSSGEELFFRVDATEEAAITFGRAGRGATSTAGAIPRVTSTGLSTILNNLALDLPDSLLS